MDAGGMGGDRHRLICLAIASAMVLTLAACSPREPAPAAPAPPAAQAAESDVATAFYTCLSPAQVRNAERSRSKEDMWRLVWHYGDCKRDPVTERRWLCALHARGDDAATKALIVRRFEAEAKPLPNEPPPFSDECDGVAPPG